MKYFKLLLAGLFFLLIIAPSLAEWDTQQVTLKVGETIGVATRSITLLAVNKDNITFVDVDNYTQDTVQTAKKIDGIWFNLTDSIYSTDPDEQMATFNITVLWVHKCRDKSECDDGDECTWDECAGHPRNCTVGYTINYCKDNDGCCNEKRCDWFNDNDCVFPCDEDEDCDDKNPCTTDWCKGGDLETGEGICAAIKITACDTGDKCCPMNCTYTKDAFNSSTDSDCSQWNACFSNSQCEDKNACTIDTCEGNGLAGFLKVDLAIEDILPENRTCKNAQIAACGGDRDSCCPAGCTYLNDYDCSKEILCGDLKCEGNETCSSCTLDCKCGEGAECIAGICTRIPEECDIVGVRNDSRQIYCSDTGWVEQKAGGKDCEENYECVSGFCKKFVCLSVQELSDTKTRNLMLGLIIAAFAGIGIYFYVLFGMNKKVSI